MLQFSRLKGGVCALKLRRRDGKWSLRRGESRAAVWGAALNHHRRATRWQTCPSRKEHRPPTGPRLRHPSPFLMRAPGGGRGPPAAPTQPAPSHIRTTIQNRVRPGLPRRPTGSTPVPSSARLLPRPPCPNLRLTGLPAAITTRSKRNPIS